MAMHGYGKIIQSQHSKQNIKKHTLNVFLPIVEIKVVLNASSENRNNTHVLPTPESPIRSNLNK